MAATTTITPRPRTSFPASEPPTSALPALPHSLTTKASHHNLRKASLLPQTPRRSSAGNIRPPSLTVQRAKTSAVPTIASTTADTGLPTPRRSVSIANFPQPPRKNSRISSLPPSPLNEVSRGEKVPSPLGSPTSTKSFTRLKQPLTASTGNLTARFSTDSGVGLSSSAGSVSGYLSPPQSRSSSAQGSYATSVTTVEASPVSADDSSRGRRTEKEGKGHVVVSVRIRPDGPDESGAESSDWFIDGRRGQVGYGGKDGGTYEYDNVFTQMDDNARVYESCAKRLVRRVMEGYHGTVFAYGMTGTGKTFSMQGITSSPGVIPLAITDIFSFIRETPHREFLLRVSYLEIYNERIHDLLATQPGSSGFVPLDQQTKGEEIKLREDPKRGVYATPLKEEIVQSPTQLLRVIARGDLARRTGSTQFNARSSRSHAVVQIVVESRDRASGNPHNGESMANNRRGGVAGGVRVSTLSLIDLAGSERAAENKERRTEGAHINRSLLTLGNVIGRLSKEGKDKDGNHLPYRDSKLTRLLQPALSGTSLISILCTIAIPSSVVGAANMTNIGETMNTLKFAARAKNNIVSHAKKADESFSGSGVDAGSRALLERYRSEIGELRKELEQQKKKEELEEREKLVKEEREVERHSEQMVEMQLARTALKERIEHLNRLILCSKSSGVNSPRSSFPNGGHMSALSMRSVSTPHPIQRLSTTSSTNNLSAISDNDEESVGEFGDGSASLATQVQALQADLTDKNHYIATLEKRLMHARKSSQSRTSFGITNSPHRASGEGLTESRAEQLLKERDEEIAELKQRLDDKERMVVALRSAARNRDVAEINVRKQSQGEEGTIRPKIPSRRGSEESTTKVAPTA